MLPGCEPWRNHGAGRTITVEETLLLESFALYLPKFAFAMSDDYKARLEHTRIRQKELIKTGMAATGNFEWAVNNSKAEGRKVILRPAP